VHVWLLFPPVTRDGAIYLAQIDLKSTLQPIFFPPKNHHGPGVKTICLDPGHGGKDPGFCIGTNQEKRRSTNQEKTYNLLLAEEVGRQLIRAGFKVSMTRDSDTFIELATRSESARRRGADLFVSLHFNATGSSQNSVQGAEVYCMTPPGAPSTNARGEGGGAGSFPGNRFNDKNLFLAYQIQKSLTGELSVEDRGVHRGRLAVLREATMPAVLVEAGFLSHPVEGRKIFTAAYRRKMAAAIVSGIQSYKRATEQAG
jgi:N-acetylmuramoyl-L-alanine amidase